MVHWIVVNLPWSEAEGSWVEPDAPNTDVEERALFEGKTYAEIESDQKRQLLNLVVELLKKESATHENDLSTDNWDVVQAFREKRNVYLDSLWSLVEKIPAMVSFQAARKAARDEHKKTYFSPQARPGMIVETSLGEKYLLGHLCCNGGIGTEEFPLRDQFITRYCICMLEMPE